MLDTSIAMKEHFSRLVAYNNWANSIVINSITQNNIDEEAILLLASHIANAQRNWYFRMIGQQDDIPLWEQWQGADLEFQFAKSSSLWFSHLDQMTEHDFDSQISYKNMGGEPCTNNVTDILTHMTNHATHHRSQIIYLMRKLSVPVPGTDFILFASYQR